MSHSVIQSVERAFVVLDRLSVSPAPQSEIGNLLGVSAAGAGKLLHTLEGCGIVRRLPSREYALGAGACRHARAYLGQTGLVSWARPVLLALSRSTGNHTILAVLEGIDQVNVMRVDASRAWSHPEFELPETIGPALPQATGRVLLAHAPDSLVAEHFACYPVGQFGGPMETREDARTELAKIRSTGHAAVVPSGRGLLYLAAPVTGVSGAVIAAVGAHARQDHDPSESIERVVGAARELSLALGGPGNAPFAGPDAPNERPTEQQEKHTKRESGERKQ